MMCILIANHTVGVYVEQNYIFMIRTKLILGCKTDIYLGLMRSIS